MFLPLISLIYNLENIITSKERIYIDDFIIIRRVKRFPNVKMNKCKTSRMCSVIRYEDLQEGSKIIKVKQILNGVIIKFVY